MNKHLLGEIFIVLLLAMCLYISCYLVHEYDKSVKCEQCISDYRTGMYYVINPDTLKIK